MTLEAQITFRRKKRLMFGPGGFQCDSSHDIEVRICAVSTMIISADS